MKQVIPRAFLLSLLVCLSTISYAQDIVLIPGDTLICGNLDSELVFNIQLVNISSVIQTIVLVRTENNLPEGWTSSLCVGGYCFSPYVDSVVSIEPVHPRDTAEATVHVSQDRINPGTAHIQIQIGTIHNPDVRTTVNLTASTLPAAVNGLVDAVDDFSLMQNYPNPFNSSTRIDFSIPTRSDVCLKVYDITGSEIITLVDGVKDAGTYAISFDGKELASGIYLYMIITGEFTTARKMHLIK